MADPELDPVTGSAAPTTQKTNKLGLPLQSYRGSKSISHHFERPTMQQPDESNRQDEVLNEH